MVNQPTKHTGPYLICSGDAYTLTLQSIGGSQSLEIFWQGSRISHVSPTKCLWIYGKLAKKMLPESDGLISLAFHISMSHKEVALKEVVGFHSPYTYTVWEQEADGSSMQFLAELSLLFIASTHVNPPPHQGPLTASASSCPVHLVDPTPTSE